MRRSRARLRRLRRTLSRRGVPPLQSTDALAGISMALVLIPQSLAYAALIGVPPWMGLYAAAVPTIAAALFASSPYLQTGPTAVTSILVLGALTTTADMGTPQYIAAATLLALMVGLIRIGIGLIRAGKIVYLMSEPVLRGFTAGAALLILLTQVPVVLGLPTAPSSGAVTTVGWVLSRVSEWRIDSTLIAAAVLGIVGGAARLHPLVPGALIATVAAIAFSGLTGYTGPVVGEVPAALPTLTLAQPLLTAPSLLLPAVVIALVGFSEAAAIARMYAARERQRWDPDRDFISQGAANVAAGLTGGFPVGGSFSRSGLAYLLGTRTVWSGAITGLTVLAFLPFARVLAPLPDAVLAAMIMAAVIPLIRLQPMLDLWALSRPQFLVGLATFLLTLLLAPRIDEAVVLGIGCAIAVHLWREFRIKVTTWSEGDAVHVRPEGVLWFGSAQMLERDVLELIASERGARRLVLHMERLGRVDLTGSLALETLITEAREAGLAVEIVSIHPTTARALSRVMRRRTPGAGAVAVDGDSPAAPPP